MPENIAPLIGTSLVGTGFDLYHPPYQLRQSNHARPKWQVVKLKIRGGVVVGYETYSPWYADQVLAQAHLDMRVESSRRFKAWADGVIAAAATRVREQYGSPEDSCVCKALSTDEKDAQSRK